MRASAKMRDVAFIDKMEPFQKLYSMTLTDFEGQIFQMLVSWKQSELDKMHHTVFMDFDICHQMAPLRLSYSINLTF